MRLYVCIIMYTYTDIYTPIHMYVYTYTHMNTHTHTLTFICEGALQTPQVLQWTEIIKPCPCLQGAYTLVWPLLG